MSITFKYIKLTQGKRAKVDQDMFECINFFKWRTAFWGGRPYAVRTVNRKEVSMHRFIMNPFSSKFDIDHINGNGLDNRKENLRICTRSQNLMNQRKKKTILGCKPTSKYKGVYCSRDQKRKKMWAAQINDKDMNIFLGRWRTEIEAAVAYNKKAQELFGDYALLNKVGASST